MTKSNILGRAKTTAIMCAAIASDKSYNPEIRGALEEAAQAIDATVAIAQSNAEVFHLPAMMTLDYHLERVVWNNAPQGVPRSAREVYQLMRDAPPEQMIQASKSLHDFIVMVYGHKVVAQPKDTPP